MGVAIMIAGLVIAIFGVAGIAWPERFVRAIDMAKMSPSRIYGAAAVRLSVGVVLVVGSSSTRFPSILMIVGALAIVGGMLVPILGVERIRSIIDWWTAQPVVFKRLCFGATTAIGGFLAYSGSTSLS